MRRLGHRQVDGNLPGLHGAKAAAGTQEKGLAAGAVTWPRVLVRPWAQPAQQPHLLAYVAQRQGQLGGDGAFPDAALSREDKDDVLNTCQVPGLWGEQELGGWTGGLQGWVTKSLLS
jgi:hypothetical protein